MCLDTFFGQLSVGIVRFFTAMLNLVYNTFFKA
jgi:hypothetical protein